MWRSSAKTTITYFLTALLSHMKPAWCMCVCQPRGRTTVQEWGLNFPAIYLCYVQFFSIFNSPTFTPATVFCGSRRRCWFWVFPRMCVICCCVYVFRKFSFVRTYTYIYRAYDIGYNAQNIPRNIISHVKQRIRLILPLAVGNVQSARKSSKNNGTYERNR